MEKAIYHATQMLRELGFDLSDPNYKETPSRMVEVFLQFTKGIRDDNKKEIDENFNKVFPNHNGMKHYKGMIVQSPLKVYSLCSHHLLPIIYKVYFAYIPQDQRQIGFSKVLKILRLVATQPMNQENFTQKVIDIFEEKLHPKGLAIVVKGIHFCMKIRGVMSEAVNITSTVRGDFKNFRSTREEFFTLTNLK